MLSVYRINSKRKKFQYSVLVDWVRVNISLFLEKTMCIDPHRWHIEEMYSENKNIFIIYFRYHEDAIRFSYCADPQRI